MSIINNTIKIYKTKYNTENIYPCKPLAFLLSSKEIVSTNSHWALLSTELLYAG